MSHVTFIFKLSMTFLLLIGAVAPMSAQETSPTVVYAPGDSVVFGFSGLLENENDPQTDQDVLNAMLLALENRPTVMIDGAEFPIEFVANQDWCNAEGGLASAELFVADPRIAGVVGPTCSSACRAAATLFDPMNYVSISPSCTATSLATDFESFHRVIANDDAQGVENAIFVIDYLRLTDVAVIYDTSDYGSALADIFSGALVDLGGNVVYSAQVTQGEADFATIINELEALQPELIFYAGFSLDAGNLAKAKQEAGLTDTALLVGDGAFGSEFVTVSEGGAEGAYASLPSAQQSDALTDFTELFTEAYDHAPETPYFPYGVDALHILMDGIEAVGELDADGNLVIDRMALREFIENVGSPDPIIGLSGRLQCNGHGECALGGIGYYQVTNGEFVRMDVSTTIVLDF